MEKSHRRRFRPDKAAASALGSGFYSRIEATQAGWPACSCCGNKTALVDSEHGECLRCALDRKLKAREAAPEASGPF